MPKISNYLYQKENTLYTKYPCKIIINMSDYDMDNSIEINDDETSIWVKSLLCRIEFEDLIFNIILDYPVSILIPNAENLIQDGKEKIIIEYKANDSLVDVPLEKREIKEQVLYVKRLVGGKEVFKDTSHLLMKLYKIYGPIASDMDLVHLEILISQSLRDREDPSIAARLGKDPDHPEMVNIKKNIFNTGFLQGLAFENVGEAIRSGLISKKKSNPSIIERVLTGTIVEDKKRG